MMTHSNKWIHQRFERPRPQSVTPRHGGILAAVPILAASKVDGTNVEVVMGKAVENEVHWEPLEAIANEELGIGALTESDQMTADVRLVRIGALANALQRAYDFGLMMGHTVAKAEQVTAAGSILRCRSEQEWVRAAAADILSTRSHSH
jgi:hypothetical protein